MGLSIDTTRETVWGSLIYYFNNTTIFLKCVILSRYTFYPGDNIWLWLWAIFGKPIPNKIKILKKDLKMHNLGSKFLDFIRETNFGTPFAGVSHTSHTPGTNTPP